MEGHPDETAGSVKMPLDTRSHAGHNGPMKKKLIKVFLDHGDAAWVRAEAQRLGWADSQVVRAIVQEAIFAGRGKGGARGQPEKGEAQS